MAKLKIYKFPDVVLAQKALPIARVDKTYFKKADDMLETMYHAPGIGLAANQVGLLERMLVLDVDYESEEIPEGETPPEGAEVVGGEIIRNKNPILIFNPKVIHREGEILYKEGCLSVPEYQAEVKRSGKLTLEYTDINGLTKTLDAEGLLAVAIQHEIDHLDGKLFIERLSPLKKDLAKKRLLKDRALREQGIDPTELRSNNSTKSKRQKKDFG